MSQESIGDTKTTRRFWEQMIAADKLSDDDDDVSYDDDDDVSDDDDDVSDDDDDFTDEEDADSLHHDQRDSVSKSQIVDHQNDSEGQKSQNSSRSESVIPNGNGVRVNGRGNDS